MSLFLKIIADATDEVNFHFTSEGISIQCMDGGHISYLMCNMPKDFLDDFNCEESKIFGINMKSLIKIFNISKLNTGLTAIFHNDYIDFYIKSETLDKKYIMRQMVIDTETLSIPDMEWDYHLTLSSNEYVNVNSSIKSKAEGIIGLVKIKVKPYKFVNNTDNKFFKMGVSSKYLFHYAKARTLSDSIHINIKKDCPIKLTYDLGDGGVIYNYVAPKIE